MLSLVGLAVVVLVGVTTAHSVVHDIKAGGAKTPYTHYLSWGWPAGVGLLVGGLVVKRFARIMVGDDDVQHRQPERGVDPT